METTAGKSYAYNIPKEYTSTTLQTFPTYKSLSEYGACKGGGIVDPTPVSTIPSIFYHMKPHNMQNQNMKNFSYTNTPFVNTHGKSFSVVQNPVNYSPYNTIYQSPYTWNGWANEKYPSNMIKNVSYY